MWERERDVGAREGCGSERGRWEQEREMGARGGEGGRGLIRFSKGVLFFKKMYFTGKMRGVVIHILAAGKGGVWPTGESAIGA